MSDPFDVQAAADAVLRGGRLTEVPMVTPSTSLGQFDGEERDVLVQGDLASVFLVKGQRSLLVMGCIRASAEQPIRIEMKGDVIVTGSIYHTQILARNILVGGDATGAQLTAAQDLRVGGTLHGGRVVTGDYEDDRHRVEACRMSLEQTRLQSENLDRRVTTDEKRLDKSCSTLRIPLDFNVGRIVQHDNGRVSIDLSLFYTSMEGRADEQIELALAEFFAKGVVGVITRANRKYLVNYPAREKVFMQLVRALRELFEAVLERDRLAHRLAWLDGRLAQMVDAVARREGTVAIHGGIAGSTEMEFILPRVTPAREGDGFEFAHQTARLELHAISAAAVEVVSRGADGERTASTVPATELEGSRFAVDDGRVLWEHVAVADAVGA